MGTWRITRVDGDMVTAAQIEATAAAGAPPPRRGRTCRRAGLRLRADPRPHDTVAESRPHAAAASQWTPGHRRGHTELSAGRFVITSSAELFTWYALGTAPTHAYRASTRLAVTPGLGPHVVAALQLVAAARADLEPGDLVFGKTASGLVLARFDGPDRWTRGSSSSARADRGDDSVTLSRATSLSSSTLHDNARGL